MTIHTHTHTHTNTQTTVQIFIRVEATMSDHDCPDFLTHPFASVMKKPKIRTRRERKKSQKNLEVHAVQSHLIFLQFSNQPQL